jgi:hypothetical protein
MNTVYIIAETLTVIGILIAVCYPIYLEKRLKEPDKMPIKIGNRIKNFFYFIKRALIDLIDGFNGESRWSLVVEDWRDMITKKQFGRKLRSTQIVKNIK